jgi:hypothetical protein
MNSLSEFCRDSVAMSKARLVSGDTSPVRSSLARAVVDVCKPAMDKLFWRGLLIYSRLLIIVRYEGKKCNALD